MVLRSFYLLLIVLCSCSCARGSESQPVARLGEVTLSLDQFNSFAKFYSIEDAFEKKIHREYVTGEIQNFLVGYQLYQPLMESDPDLFHDADLEAEAAWRAKVFRMVQERFVTAYAQDLPKLFSPEMDEKVEARKKLMDIPPKRAKWSHIYLPFEGDDQKEEQRKKGMEVLQKLKAGESFEELIPKYSEDLGASSDQVFGPMSYHGKVLPEMAEAIDGLEKKGDISGLVETPIAYFIFKLQYRNNPAEQLDHNLRIGIYRELEAAKHQEKSKNFYEMLKGRYEVTKGSPEEGFIVKVHEKTVYPEELKWFLQKNNPDVPLMVESVWDEKLYEYIVKQELVFAYQQDEEVYSFDYFNQLKEVYYYNARVKKAIKSLLPEITVSEKEIERDYQQHQPDPVYSMEGLAFDISKDQIVALTQSHLVKDHLEYLNHFFLANQGLLSGRPSELPPEFKPFIVQSVNIPDISKLPEMYRLPIESTVEFSATAPLRWESGWRVFYVYNKGEKVPALEDVAEAIQEKLSYQKKEEAEKKLRAKVLKENEFELLINLEDLVLDSEENYYLKSQAEEN